MNGGITAGMMACAGTGTQLEWPDAADQTLTAGDCLPRVLALNKVIDPKVPNVWLTPKEFMFQKPDRSDRPGEQSPRWQQQG